MKWFVYILKCADNTLYTGITTNIERRFKEHIEGKGAKYTKAKIAVAVVYIEAFTSRSEALVREAAIKRLTRLQKEKLIEQKT